MPFNSRSQRNFQRIKIQPLSQEKSRNPVWLGRPPIISILLRAEYEDFGVNNMCVLGVEGPDWKTLGNLPGRGGLEQGLKK